jgi:hypothetical protein
MATKTRTAELEERKANEEQALRDLEAQAASKAAAIKALEEMVAADLAAVAVGDLGRESKKQANAKLEADALRIESRELDRRIGKQREAIAQTGRDLLAEDRAEVAAAGAALAAELTADLAQVAGKLARLKELDSRHMSLDARIAAVSGYPGSHIPGAQNYLELFPFVLGFKERERLLQKRRAEGAGK